MQDAKEEVRSKLAIEDVIGEYVPLKRAGRNFKGLSPFTSEKTPSFTVSPDKNIWYDFSSNRGGDIFSFVMEVEGVGFAEALQLLARKAGVELSKYDAGHDHEMDARKKRLLEIHKLITNFYQHNLVGNKNAVAYVFGKRKIDRETAIKFQLGYAPNTMSGAVDYLRSKGFTQQEIIDAGLTNRRGGDLFRSRIMVPLDNQSGDIIGFTGRILEDEPNAPKYLNTPQSLLYDKGRHVFGFSHAKATIRKKGYAVLVEGNMDVITTHQFGHTETVATAGTALTASHLRTLQRVTEHVKLAFDGDKAGIAATERAIPIAESVGVKLSIISLPEAYKDPDEALHADPAIWEKAVEESKQVVDWIFEQYARMDDLTSSEGKMRFTDRALRIIRQLGNSVEKEHYLEHLATFTGGSGQILLRRLDELGDDAPEVRLRPVKNTEFSEPAEVSIYQDNLLAVALTDATTHDLLRDVDAGVFDDEQRQEIVGYIQTHLGTTIKETPKDLQKHDTYVKILLLKADARYAAWSDQDRYFEAARLLRQIIRENKKKQKEILTHELRDAETVGDEKRSIEIRAELNTLIKEIQSGPR